MTFVHKTKPNDHCVTTLAATLIGESDEPLRGGIADREFFPGGGKLGVEGDDLPGGARGS